MGAAVARRCALSHDVTAWKRSDLDVSDLSAIQPKLLRLGGTSTDKQRQTG
jgi:hypothetical protein